MKTLENLPERRMLFGLFFVNFILRISLISINTGAYTDGVLQVTQAEEGVALWPPLYGWITRLFSVGIEPLYAGRLVSALAGAFGLIPLWKMSRRVGGKRAAFYAALIYTVAPVSLRWSGRMMTDALAATFIWAALERWESSCHATRWSLRDSRLAYATLFASAATLTRFQGVLLAPLIACSWLWIVWKNRNHFSLCRKNIIFNFLDLFPWRTLLASIVLAVLFLWLHFRGVAHGEQFQDRLGTQLGDVLKILSINGEAFLSLTPYFLTYPVAIWAFYGLVCREQRGDETFIEEESNSTSKRCSIYAILVTLYIGFSILILQSAFSSFQERYLLPWLGLLWCWAGIGMASAQTFWKKTPRLFSCAVGVTLIWSAGFAMAVLFLQRQAFGDFADAGKWIRENATANTSVYSTELYNPSLGGKRISTNKIRFFSGRDVQYLAPPYRPGFVSWKLQSEDLVCLHSAYSPQWTEAALRKSYLCEKVFESQSLVIPLFPDIMSRPGVAQNPSAWIWRYEPQMFSTTIWRIGSPKLGTP